MSDKAGIDPQTGRASTREGRLAYEAVRTVGLSILLQGSLDHFATNQLGRGLPSAVAWRRWRLWAALSPDRAERASVSLAVTVGALMRADPLSELNPQASLDIEDTIRETYGFPKEDQDFLSELLAGLERDLADQSQHPEIVSDVAESELHGRVVTAAMAQSLELACGRDRVRRLPPFHGFKAPDTIKLLDLAHQGTTSGQTLESGHWWVYTMGARGLWNYAESEYLGLARGRSIGRRLNSGQVG